MNNSNEATRLVCLEAAQKLRTYVGIYTGDKQARRLIDELSNIASALASSAAPAPQEAKAEQDKLCPIDLAHPVGEKRRVRIASDEMIDGERVLCITIEDPAPASRPEASELPDLPDAYDAMHYAANRAVYTTDQMRAYGQLCRDTASGTRADLWPGRWV